MSLLTLTGSPVASTSLPVAFTGPVTLGDGRDEWTVVFAGGAVQYVFTATATIAGTPTSFSGIFNGDGIGAVGQIIDQSTLAAYLGTANLAIISNQNDAATTTDAVTVQGCIDTAESAVFSVLLQLQCSGGTFFKYPFTIGGVVIKSSGSLIALPLLQEICHQYAAFGLNNYRMVMSIAEGEEGQTGIDKQTKAWKDQGDDTLRRIIRWAEGYTDGQYVELDLNTGAVVGQIYRAVTVTFAGATVGPTGLPDVVIVNPAVPCFAPGWPVVVSD